MADFGSTNTKRFHLTPLALSVSLCTVLGVAQPASGTMLEEIVVTAQHRSESLQDVPISVNAMSGEAIQETGVTDMESVTASLPSVTVTKTLSGDQLMIRGVGSGGNPGFQQSVGTFIDGIYMGKGQQSRSKFLDIERFEVLRGPQSIYFGNNTIGGAMNIITKKPGDELEGFATAYIEPSDGEYNFEGAVGGPISDSLGVRVALSHTELEGYMNNQTKDKNTPNQEGDTGRIVLAWTLSEEFDATFKGEVSRFEQDGENAQVVGCPPPAPFHGAVSCSPAVVNTPGFEDDFDTNLQTGGIGAPAGTFFDEQRNELDTENYVLTMNWQLGGHTLTSITGLSSYDSLRIVDVDLGPNAVLASRRTEEFEQASQEVRLLSPADEAFSYILGAYYQTDEFDFGYDQLRNFGPTAAFSVASKEEVDNWSVFGSFTWNISDTVRTTLGLRYTEVDKKARHQQQRLSIDLSAPGPAQLGFLGSKGIDDHDFGNSRTDEDLTPSINVQWDVTSDVMLYASFAQGFKAGGFDPLVQNASTNQPGGGYAFEPEQVDAWELGAKSTLLDGAMELNLALFRSEYQDLQVTTFNVVTTAFNVGNAATSITQGLEVDGRWAVTDELTVNFALMLLDASYEEYEGGTCTIFQSLNAGPGCVQDLSGDELVYAPNYAGNIGFEYVRPVSEDLEVRANLTVNFTDGYSYVGDNDPRYFQDAYEKLDLRVALADADGSWEVALVGKNLTDEFTAHYGGDLPAGYAAGYKYLDRPRTVALQARYNF